MSLGWAFLVGYVAARTKSTMSSSQWETLNNMERRKTTNLFQIIFFIVAIMLLLIILHSHVN